MIGGESRVSKTLLLGAALETAIGEALGVDAFSNSACRDLFTGVGTEGPLVGVGAGFIWGTGTGVRVAVEGLATAR